jgi:hypothetical protein
VHRNTPRTQDRGSRDPTRIYSWQSPAPGVKHFLLSG